VRSPRNPHADPPAGPKRRDAGTEPPERDAQNLSLKRVFRRGRLPVVGVAALVVAGALVAWIVPWGTTPAAPPDAKTVGFATPPGYHITYEVTVPGTPVTTEQRWVERPFNSVDETLSGPPPGGSLQLAIVARIGAQVFRNSADSEGALIYSAVAPAANDIRLGAVLGLALAERRLRFIGTSSVLGRRCRVFRSAASLTARGPLPVLGSGSNYVDSCIDDDGLVLSEATFRDRALAERRRAVSVEVGTAAAAGGDYQMPGTPTPYNQGGGSFTALTATSRPPGPSWTPSWLPPGFGLTGVYDVVPYQPQAFDPGNPQQGPPTPSGLPGSLVAEIDYVYVSGPDVVVIEQGGTINGAKFKPPTGGENVQLGPLGLGQLGLSASASLVTAEPTKGLAFVRVSGTVSPSVLERVARSMHLAPAGTIVTLPSRG